MSFENFVRPFVSRPISPSAPARPAVPEDKPERGVAVLRGLGGKLIDLSYSETQGWSKSKPVETKRVVDRERVYQKEPGAPGGQGVNGPLPPGVNPDNYVDIERVKKLEMEEGDGTRTEYGYAVPDDSAPDRDNIEVLQKDVTIKNPRAPEPEGDVDEEGGTPP